VTEVELGLRCDGFLETGEVEETLADDTDGRTVNEVEGEGMLSEVCSEKIVVSEMLLCGEVIRAGWQNSHWQKLVSKIHLAQAISLTETRIIQDPQNSQNHRYWLSSS
jgi:hypothetical protein